MVVACLAVAKEGVVLKLLKLFLSENSHLIWSISKGSISCSQFDGSNIFNGALDFTSAEFLSKFRQSLTFLFAK